MSTEPNGGTELHLWMLKERCVENARAYRITDDFPIPKEPAEGELKVELPLSDWTALCFAIDEAKRA